MPLAPQVTVPMPNVLAKSVTSAISVASTTPATPLLAPTPQSTLLPDYVNYSELRRALQSWRAAWTQRNVDTYLASYAPNFVPDTGGDTNAWKDNSRAFLARSADIAVEIADLSVTLTDATRPSMVFKQTYKSESNKNVVIKTLHWVRVDDRWLISRESSETPEPGSQ